RDQGRGGIMRPGSFRRSSNAERRSANPGLRVSRSTFSGRPKSFLEGLGASGLLLALGPFLGVLFLGDMALPACLFEGGGPLGVELRVMGPLSGNVCLREN